LQRAIALQPTLAGAYNALGVITDKAHRYTEAEAHWVAAIEAAPDDTAALCNFSGMLTRTGRGDEATALMSPAAEALPGDIAVQWSRAVAANYDPTLTPEQVADQHRRYGQAVRAKLPPEALHPNALLSRRRVRGRPLKVGFLSPDMRDHPVGSFLLPLLKHLDRTRVRPYAFSLAFFPDQITECFRVAVDDFVPCAHLSDLELVQRVRAEALDVLIECAGLSEGGRPAALALRMAPLQITWLGYPNTTGLPNVDIRLVDALTDPKGAETLATERLERLEGCFVCWESRHDISLPVRDPLRPLTFGGFNALSKTHEGVLTLWARLLAQVPDSRLLLKAGPLADPAIADMIRQTFTKQGIASDRLDLRPHTVGQIEHLATYGEIDIALDTFPYHGTTTTCEALWMGTPVVVLAGRGHPARVGMSLLTAAGFPEWIAATPDEYLTIANGLATDRQRLAEYHLCLRDRMEGSSLCDGAGFARRFEALLERLEERPSLNGIG
jgi:predicted O-linked N-acetylglucosamine transferase (SPINDLY family)